MESIQAIKLFKKAERIKSKIENTDDPKKLKKLIDQYVGCNKEYKVKYLNLKYINL
jgi:hypothetical protein